MKTSLASLLLLQYLLFSFTHTQPISVTKADSSAGGVAVYANVHSLNNIFKTLIPTLSYFFIENKTYNLDYQ